MALTVDLNQLSSLTAAQMGQEGQQAQSTNVQEAIQANQAAAKAPENVRWNVPELPPNYNLTTAKARAYAVAQNHMNQRLAGDALHVSLHVDETQPPTSPSEVTAKVKEQTTQAPLKTYSGLDILRLFAHNTKPKGIIADGTI